MTFLSPWALALAALALPLVLLYFLRVRRQPHRVSSVMLWAPVRRDQRASALFQRLQFDPLLLLQALALLLLVLALARPTILVPGQSADRLVLVMDMSASMQAGDVVPSRFRAAQTRAAALVDEAGPGAEVMVIEAGAHAAVRVPFTRDHGRARSGVWALEAHDLPNRLDRAVRTALTLVPAGDPRVRIYVLTDGAFDPALAQEFSDPRIRWVGIGGGARNVAITGFTVRKRSYDAYDYQAFVSLTNFGDNPVRFPLTLTLDDRSLSEQSVTLAPGVKRNIIVPFTHPGGGRLRVEARVADDLAVDNAAVTTLPAPQKLRVLLVSPGNLFLEKALRTDPQVILETKPAGEYAGGMPGADVVVLDNTAPPKIGAGRFVLVHALPGDVPIEALGQLQQPTVLDWDRGHPVMRFVDLTKVGIESALRVRPLAPGRTLLEAVGGPLIYLLEEPQRKAVFVGFDLFKTDLPLRVAFPMILANSLRWLHPVALEGTDLTGATGHPILLPVEHGVDAATVRDPAGRDWPVPVTRGAVSFAQTDRVGVYTLRAGARDIPFAVNLADPAESDIRPRPLPETPASSPGSAEAFTDHRALWRILLVLAILTLVFEGLLYARRQTAGRWRLSRPADRWALGLRAASVAVLLWSLTQPQLARWVDRQNVVFLLDVSESVTLAARETAYRFVTGALEAMKADDRAGLITFAREPEVIQPLRPRPTFARPARSRSGTATDIERALQLALASAPTGEATRVVLLSDGRETTGSARAAAQAAKDAGIAIDYVPLRLTFSQEVIVENLLVPREVKFGEAFHARVVVQAAKEGSGRLSLYRNGEFLGSQIVRLTAGKNVLAYRQGLEQAGAHVYQALVEVDGDVIEENNRAVGLTVVRGRPQVLLVDKEPPQAAPLAAALRSQHIDVRVTGPEGLPATVAGLQKYDGVILSNVSAVKLTQAHMTAVREYVRDQGGGLVMIGGEESFGLGGYYRTPIEEALPVTMEVKQKLEVPSLAVVLVIDRSGSMTAGMKDNDKVSRLEVAKEAAHHVVDVLNEQHEIGVLSFDTEFTWTVPLRPATNKAAIHREIATLRPGGGTDGYPAVREAYRELLDREALLKHVIFMTDGEMPLQNFPLLVPKMVKDKITVSSVAIGSETELRFLANVAKWGRGRFYFTDETATVPRIFTLETQLASKAALVEQPFRPLVTQPSHEAIQDVDWAKAPPLGGYVATTAKPTADQVLMTHQEDPLLAAWRYGLGRAVAFTADAKGKWSLLWLPWREFNKFWAQAVRWTLRADVRSDMTVTVQRESGRGVVTVDAVDPNGEFINFLDTQLGVVTPDKRQAVVELAQVAPGRYQGTFPARQEGVYVGGLSQRRDQQLAGSQLVGLVVPYAEEFRRLGADEAFLQELADLTGGTRLGEPTETFTRHRRRSRVPTDLWPWLVGLVTLAFVPEIALRRLGPMLPSWRRRPGEPHRDVAGSPSA